MQYSMVRWCFTALLAIWFSHVAPSLMSDSKASKPKNCLFCQSYGERERGGGGGGGGDRRKYMNRNYVC